LADVIESMPSLARELGKEPPAINIVDHGIVVRTQLSGVLRDVFTHALRNSLDHGLEPAEVRLAKGKPAAGKIELEVDLSDAGLHMKLRDDGAGLALGKIRRKAVDKGLITETTAAVTSAETFAALIFDSGFSTADKLTEVSGRGVGMSAVRGFVQAAGGDVSVRLLDQAEQAELRRFELVINLPGKYACVADAA
jgi:two-component system chemotaxis sensor kinase CheA